MPLVHSFTTHLHSAVTKSFTLQTFSLNIHIDSPYMTQSDTLSYHHCHTLTISHPLKSLFVCPSPALPSKPFTLQTFPQHTLSHPLYMTPTNTITDTPSYHHCHSPALPSKPFTLQTFRRYVSDQSPPSTPGPPADPETPLSLRELRRQLQRLLEEERETGLIVETGDSWFIGQSLRIPAGVSQSNFPVKCTSQISQSITQV